MLHLFQGYPGADTTSFFAAYSGAGSIPGTDCQMNGFNNEILDCYQPCPPNAQYGYVPPNESTLYVEMAEQYVLADRMFASNFDLSYASHQYMIAAQANRAVDFPSNAWRCTGPNNVISTLTFGKPLTADDVRRMKRSESAQVPDAE